jgi:hypothetical protein
MNDSTPITNALPLSVRALNVLYGNRHARHPSPYTLPIRTIGELRSLPHGELLKRRGCGRVVGEEIRAFLANLPPSEPQPFDHNKVVRLVNAARDVLRLGEHPALRDALAALNDVVKHYDAKHPHILCHAHDPVGVEQDINADGWTVGMGWSHSDRSQQQADGRWLLYVEPLEDM